MNVCYYNHVINWNTFIAYARFLNSKTNLLFYKQTTLYFESTDTASLNAKQFWIEPI